jgi:signal transduction histidine kinase/DNA-binding NarL/FixJ family response regulator
MTVQTATKTIAQLLRQTLSLGCLLLGLAAHGAPVAVVMGAHDSLTMTDKAGYWVDAQGSSTATAADLQHASRQSFAAMAQPSLSRMAGALWVRLELDNPGAPTPYVIQVGARFEHVDAWLLADEQPFADWATAQYLGHAGQTVPLLERPLNATAIAYPLDLPGGRSTVMLRLKSRTTLAPDLSLWQPTAWTQAKRIADWRDGLETGALVFAALLALLFGLWLRELSWIWYSLMTMGLLLYLSGHSGATALWLWPSNPERVLLQVSVSLALAHLFGSLFFLRFFGTNHLPRWGRHALLGFGMLSVFGTLVCLTVGYQVGIVFQEISGVALPLLVTLLAALAWRRSFDPGRFVLMSFALLAGASTLRVAMHHQWLNLPTSLEQWLLPVAAVLATATLMLALADQVLRLRRDQMRAERAHGAELEGRIVTATQELALARDAAQAANRFKREFLARVSHDLRTPMHTLLGYADLAQRAMAPDADNTRARTMLAAMERSGQDVMELIDELLQFARGEEGHLVLAPRATYVGGLARDVLEHTQPLAKRGDNRLVLAGRVDVPVVWVDEARLRQVLQNLLTNACAATRNGSITLTLSSVWASEADPTEHARAVLLTCSVTDTGRGIAPADLARVFQPFSQGPAGTVALPAQGFGLGLAICRQWVRQMDSDLTVQSTLGVGSVFAFTLRTVEAPEAQATAPAPLGALDSLESRISQPWLAAGYDGPVRHILVVDDVPEHCALMGELLTCLDFDVYSCGGATPAITLLQGPLGARVDLVLIDQVMPDGDGWELLRWCRQNRAALPVVLLSATPAKEHESGNADGLQFNAQLLKPVRVNELQKVLGEQLGLNWTDAQASATRRVVLPVQAPKSANMANSLSALRQLAFEGRGLEVDAWLEQHEAQMEPQLLQELLPLADQMQHSRMVTVLDSVLHRASVRDGNPP